MSLSRRFVPHVVGLVLMVPLLFSCDHLPFGQKQGEKTKSEGAPESQRPPSATEVFHLRTECGEFGVRLLNENFVGRALTQSQVSHYDPKTNRCFVELTVQSADLSGKFMASYLYDGQTKELLAFTESKDGVKRFLTFKTYTNSYEQAQEYINSKMEDKDYSK
ncbi:hypothetical protein [Geothrix terrae]|uniref:hypothetical protein n=1 Tax=Geothrix terrae TaxID=2922720 RepID=UPI001FABEF81|nr:hypothetical protein [Geothrix terrae]